MSSRKSKASMQADRKTPASHIDLSLVTVLCARLHETWEILNVDRS